MRDQWAVGLVFLVIPSGASTGARVEIDGTTGEVRIYDTNGDLRISGGGTIAPEFWSLFTADPDETNPAGVGSGTVGGGTIGLLELLSPAFGGDYTRVQLRSENVAGTVPAAIYLGNGQGGQPQRLGMDAGTNKFLHTGVVLAAGTSGAVANPVVTASSVLFLTRSVPGGVLGHLSYTVGAGTFTINSSAGGDTSTVDVLIVEPF